MISPPVSADPWAYPLPASVPPGLGGVFNAWGWARQLFDAAIPSAVDDLFNYSNMKP